MKKVLFSVFAVAAAMTACSKSDVVDAPNIDTPISFEAYAGKVPVSKANSINNVSDLNAFNVYAYETTVNTEGATEVKTPDYNKPYSLMNGVLVSYVDNQWTYGSAIYWPNNSESLTFIAYNDFGKTGDKTNNNYSYTAPNLTVTIPEDVTAQQDVLVAKGFDTKNTTSAVSLQFQHILSRVYFTVNSDRNLTIKSVKVNGSFASVGTYNIDQLEYTTAPSTASVQYDLLGTGTYSYTKTNGVAQIKGTASDNYYFMLLPSATPDATIEVTYSFEGEESVTYKVTTPYTGAFAAGKSYQFKLNMVSKQIQFAVGIAPWYEEGENATNTETVVDLSAGSTVTVVTNSNTNNNTENA